MKEDKIVIITKKTALEELLQRHATTSQVKFYLESKGESYKQYLQAHLRYKKSVQKSLHEIPTQYQQQRIDKQLLPTYQFRKQELIVVIGDPGLFVNAAKYVGEQPVIVVNPDKENFSDVFTSCYADTLSKTIQEYEQEKTKTEYLSMIEAKLEDGQTLLGLNDIFIGQQTHTSARYNIKTSYGSENQSSSGIVISTGTGSTAWMKAIIEGARQIAKGYGARVYNQDTTFSRSKKELRYFVREPFATATTGTTMTTGRIVEKEHIKIQSHMPRKGVIFSDGIEEDYIEFNAGTKVDIYLAKHQIKLIRRKK